MKRLFPLSLLLLLLLSLACATARDPGSVYPPSTAVLSTITRGVSSAVQVDSEKVILVDLSESTVMVTPWRVRLESPDQEVIWLTADPSWQLDIEFKQNALPRPCPAPARRCHKRFGGEHRRVYEYDVILTTPHGTFRVDPELEIRY